jgi:hypothetical protein
VSLMSRLRGTPYSDDTPDTQLADEVQHLSAQLELVQEAAADAERALAADNDGWVKLAQGTAGTFTRQQLRDITARCRLGQWNALIGRGLELRTAYIHGSGVQVSAVANGAADDNAAQQDVNAVVQAFLDDPGNQAAFTGPQAREECERALGTDGNVFVACFTSPLTGAVHVADLPWDQVDDIVNGDDGRPTFYRRAWVDNPTGAAGAGVRRVAYYPALGYRPGTRVAAIDGNPVMWDAPVLHVLVNRPTRGAKFGVPDAFRAVAWASAYKEFLEDWAKLVKSLSKLAWKTTTKGSTQQAKARQQLGRATAADAPVGQAAVVGPDTTLEAIGKSGATIDSESGRPLAAMVASALGVPVTMLLGDPGTVGARATAETLDRPTELMAGMRRTLWTQAYQALLAYVIDQAVLAPQGPLQGAVTVDDFGREVVVLAGDTDRTVSVDWPDLTETPLDVVMAALSMADGMGKVPPLVMLRMVLHALGVADVDEVLAQVTDPVTGAFLPPAGAAPPAPAVPPAPADAQP